MITEKHELICDNFAEILVESYPTHLWNVARHSPYYLCSDLPKIESVSFYLIVTCETLGMLKGGEIVSE